MKSVVCRFVLLTLALLAIQACEQPVYNNSSELDVHTPYFNGTWTLSQVQQNDLRVAPGGLKSLDVSQLFLDENSSFTFQEDGSFSATGFFATQIGSSGSWQLDDERFPTAIAFSSSDGSPVTLELGASVVEFSEKMQLVDISDGCDGDPATSYTYIFDKQ